MFSVVVVIVVLCFAAIFSVFIIGIIWRLAYTVVCSVFVKVFVFFLLGIKAVVWLFVRLRIGFLLRIAF